MSEAVTALNGARYEGIATIAEAPLGGMVTLRGDLSGGDLAAAVREAAGIAVPGRRGVVAEGPRSALWMAPDELLLLMPYAEAPETAAGINTALAGRFALAVDVSDARARLTVSGPRAREVLAKLCPVDFAPGVFAPGEVRRTRAAQAAVAVWMSGQDEFSLICFRSVARYVFDLLGVAAAPGGEVGAFD